MKEAVWKALGHDGLGPLLWRDIVTYADGNGSWFGARLEGELADQARARGIHSIVASTSVMDDIVVAVAIAERRGLPATVLLTGP